MGMERLQKILAHAGYGSRRACEDMIRQGRVIVDGRIAQLGDKADPESQRITLDGQPVRLTQSPAHIYVMLNKPRGAISTVRDPHGRRTVRDLVPLPGRLYPVGRLDADSEGLILMTDDGQLTQRLTHPRYGHDRVYRVLVAGDPEPKTLDRWRRGITLDGKPARFKDVTVASRELDETWLRVTVTEGRNHLVRRIVAALGHPAQRLIRVQLGPLELGELPPKRWRYLTQVEIRALDKEVGVTLNPARPRTQYKRSSRGQSSRRRTSSSRRRRN